MGRRRIHRSPGRRVGLVTLTLLAQLWPAGRRGPYCASRCSFKPYGGVGALHRFRFGGEWITATTGPKVLGVELHLPAYASGSWS